MLGVFSPLKVFKSHKGKKSCIRPGVQSNQAWSTDLQIYRSTDRLGSFIAIAISIAAKKFKNILLKTKLDF